MSYSLEKIYEMVGRDDKVCIVYFHEDSDTAKIFKDDLVVVFLYDQFEREHLEEKYLTKNEVQTYGMIKARYLGSKKLSDEHLKKLKTTGINCNDIKLIFPDNRPSANLFHSNEIRSITEIPIPIKRLPKGQDNDWMFGILNSQIQKGIGLPPYNREMYLAMKIYYKPDFLTDIEKEEVYDDGVIKPNIELKYLELKIDKEENTIEEEEKYLSLLKTSLNINSEIFKKALSGINLKNFQNPSLLYFLAKGSYQFIPRHLNIVGKKAIYLDYEGFLHIFLRHSKEFQIGTRFNNKDKFLWKPDDVIMVINRLITSIDSEIQDFWDKSPNQRFSKYGQESLYFEGDYYTFHIEANGRLSTFYKNSKKNIPTIANGNVKLSDSGKKLTI